MTDEMCQLNEDVLDHTSLIHHRDSIQKKRPTPHKVIPAIRGGDSGSVSLLALNVQLGQTVQSLREQLSSFKANDREYSLWLLEHGTHRDA